MDRIQSSNPAQFHKAYFICFIQNFSEENPILDFSSSINKAELNKSALKI